MAGAIFTLSLDFELIWGTVHDLGPKRFEAACRMEQDSVLDRLLELFVRHQVPATWCVVGHLFLSSCRARDGKKHPEITAPSSDWFACDPCSSEAIAPTFYAPSLIRKIAACPVRQEIGCHSFSHVIFADCSRETAESEISVCVRLARQMGIELRSFAFPRNRVGHLDVLKQYGFTHFRGPGKNDRTARRVPDVFRRAIHLVDIIGSAEPESVVPKNVDGLWNVPASMALLSRRGCRRYIPMSLRVRRAIKGLDAAIRNRNIFHLWLHPTTMSDDSDAMFAGLAEIIRYASCLLHEGKIAFLPMSAIGAAAPEASEPRSSAVKGPR